jgi:ArsR family metal-binding transcriptional regulator
VDTFDVYELLPKFDCGLCGNPVCIALAMIPEKEMERKHPHPNIDEDVIEIHPCTENGKVTLETQLKPKYGNSNFFNDFFDQIQLCTSLSEVEMFDTMNCSSKMGYALLEFKGKRTHIFKTGRIIMRRADDREDALTTFSKISKALLPAKICSCGNMLADCFGGACEFCSKDVCAALLDIFEAKEVGDNSGITIGDILVDIDRHGNEKLSGNFKGLRDIVNEIRKIHDELRKGRIIDKQTSKNKIDEIVGKINKLCTKSILENEGQIQTIIALIQYGLGRDLIRAGDGLLSLEIENLGEQYEKATELFFSAYDAFERRDIKGAMDVEPRYKEFISSWDINTTSMGVAKIATNGFYISRILGIPVPDVSKSDTGRS